MASTFLRFARQNCSKWTVNATASVVCTAFISSSYFEDLYNNTSLKNTYCEEMASAPATSSVGAQSSTVNEKKTEPTQQQQSGMRSEEVGDFRGLFPKRQLWQPTIEYPLWDKNWDGKQPESTGSDEKDRKRMRSIRKTGVTRHIILIRHGQYDESSKEDEKRKLTPLGRLQAEVTGKRLAEMIKGAEDKFGPCNIKVVRVSNLLRAKETANIIAEQIPSVERAEPDPRLNEGRPCHTIPGSKASEGTIKATDDSHSRIEEGFREYFSRAPEDVNNDNNVETENKENENKDEKKSKHEFEIVVCHANVIRYFLCRALQLPPEAWLRLCTFNCSLTYLTIRPTGTVSCRMLGDIGHLPYNLTTFSGHHGFNW